MKTLFGQPFSKVPDLNSGFYILFSFETIAIDESSHLSIEVLGLQPSWKRKPKAQKSIKLRPRKQKSQYISSQTTHQKISITLLNTLTRTMIAESGPC